MEEKLSNPYFNQIYKNNTISSSTTCSVSGIATKILFLCLLTAVTICVALFGIVPQGSRMTLLAICGIVAFTSSLINFFLPSAAQIVGPIFCLAEGYVIGWACRTYSAIFYGIIPIVLLLTVFVVLTMAILYATKIIKANQKYRAVIGTLFLVSILVSLFVFISSFFTTVFSNFFYGNSYLSIAISLINVIIVSLYLVTDFDDIIRSTSEGYPKKCEWALAFGLVMSVIILFLRMLKLVSKILRR